MKNFGFFVISFLFIGTLTFGVSKTNQKDKLGDAVLVGILGAGFTTLMYNAACKALDEEDYIDNNTTQLKVNNTPAKNKFSKFLSDDGKRYLMPHDKSDIASDNTSDDTEIDDCTESTFFAEHEVRKNINKIEEKTSN